MSTQRKNQNDEKITIEKVREFKGLENLSDEEARNAIETLREFAAIAYRYFQIQESNNAEK